MGEGEEGEEVKTVRARRKRKETTKFSCLLSPNLVISYYIYQIRHLIIISALQKKGQIEIDCVSSKSTPIQTREMPDQFPTIHKTTEHPLTKRKKVSQEMVFSLKQNKKESFLPPFKTKKTDKNKNFPYKSNEKNSLHYSVFVSLS